MNFRIKKQTPNFKKKKKKSQNSLKLSVLGKCGNLGALKLKEPRCEKGGRCSIYGWSAAKGFSPRNVLEWKEISEMKVRMQLAQYLNILRGGRGNFWMEMGRVGLSWHRRRSVESRATIGGLWCGPH